MTKEVTTRFLPLNFVTSKIVLIRGGSVEIEPEKTISYTSLQSCYSRMKNAVNMETMSAWMHRNFMGALFLGCHPSRMTKVAAADRRSWEIDKADGDLYMGLVNNLECLEGKLYIAIDSRRGG